MISVRKESDNSITIHLDPDTAESLATDLATGHVCDGWEKMISDIYHQTFGNTEATRGVTLDNERSS